MIVDIAREVHACVPKSSADDLRVNPILSQSRREPVAKIVITRQWNLQLCCCWLYISSHHVSWIKRIAVTAASSKAVNERSMRSIRSASVMALCGAIGLFNGPAQLPAIHSLPSYCYSKEQEGGKGFGLIWYLPYICSFRYSVTL